MPAILLLLLLAAPDFSESIEGIELESLDIEAEGNYPNVSGAIINNGPHTIKDPYIEITWLKDGKVVALWSLPIKPTTLRPSVTGRFDVDVLRVEYDEYTYRVSGHYEAMPDYFTKIDEEDLIGSIDIVEGSQNVIPYYWDDYIAFYGEIVNSTPAFLNYVTVHVYAYNKNDVLLWDYWHRVRYLHPGEKGTYLVYTDEVFLEDLGRYEVTLEADNPYLLPTSVKPDSWGKVKAGAK